MKKIYNIILNRLFNRTKNNYEKIKNYSIDEMAEFIICDDCFYCPVNSCNLSQTSTKQCLKNAKQWLLSEVKND